MQYTNNFKKSKSAEANLKEIAAYKAVILFLLLCTVFITVTSSNEVYGTQPQNAVECVTDLTKNVETEKQSLMLCPGGMAFGIKIKTKGVLVVDFGRVDTDEGLVSPSEDGGVLIGDIIRRVSGQEINTVGDLVRVFNESGGRAVVVEIERDGGMIAVMIKPALNKSDNTYRAGIYVRDNTAGIGTVTFIDPVSGNFAGLGHGICDPSTGNIMPISSGEACDVIINRVVKGQKGRPGELRGCLGGESLGDIYKNCHTGIYGHFKEVPSSVISTPLPVADKDQVRTGSAYIMCTTDDNKVEKYEIEISRIQFDRADIRNYNITVTDKALIEKTGGIVQGMSGSPIIQDGRIIGAVTHVLLDNPTTGYGIFIGNMLNNMNR